MIYNPLDKKYKSITGAVPSNTQIKFRVKGDFDSVIFVVQKDGEKQCRYDMKRDQGFYELTLSFSTGLYFYYFDLGENRYIGLSSDFVGEVTSNVTKFQLGVYDNAFDIPSWLNGGIIYQIFPDRFFSSKTEFPEDANRVFHKNKNDIPVYEPNEQGEVLNNDFYGGDIKGIISKLDYLFSLNVTAIYLNPIFRAYSNHRYDTGNYFEIDYLLGDEKDLKELISEANKRGIKIILDGVFNHTGADSLYFNKYGRYDSVGAYQNEKSSYVDWYDFNKYPEYNSWWGIKTLPAVNKKEDSPFIDYICGENGVIEHYTKLGIGGWRLDVVDELPAHFVERIRKAVKKINSNAVVIGEVWEDASNKISYGKRRKYFSGDELDSVMNYPLKNAILDFVKNKDAKKLSYIIKEQADHYPKGVVNNLMNILSTHDTFRLISAVSGVKTDGLTKKQMANLFIPNEEYEECVFKVKIASLLQFTLPGVPCVYYGDEIGMQGFIDPLNRKYFDWDSKDFELLDWYKKLSKIRKELSVFSDGEYKEIYAEKEILIYKICNNESEVLICVNLSNNNCDLQFNGRLYNVIDGKTYSEKFIIEQSSFAILIKKCENS